MHLQLNNCMCLVWEELLLCISLDSWDLTLLIRVAGEIVQQEESYNFQVRAIGY